MTQPFLAVTVDDHDNARPFLALAAAGIAVAAALALFGLPPVDLHSPLHHMGVMDPGCGGTRALRLTARGHIVDAFTWNPASPLLLLGAIVMVARSALGAATGRWVNLRVATDRRLLVLVALATIALEARQQHHAALLMRPGY